MAREVDRLLAGLTNLGTQPDGHARQPSTAPAPATERRRAPRVARPRVARSTEAIARRDQIALWARVLLGIVLGGMMTQWPYPHGCGLQLAEYLGAVAVVLVAGAWIAVASWTRRSAPSHILALLLIHWGIVLAAGQVLPRIGYAAARLGWHC
jgi:hypothetical protein